VTETAVEHSGSSGGSGDSVKTSDGGSGGSGSSGGSSGSSSGSVSGSTSGGSGGATFATTMTGATATVAAAAATPTTSGASSSARVVVERDRQGFERRAGELLMVGAAGDVAAARSAGYQLIEQTALANGEVLARLQLRDGDSVEAGIAGLQAAAPSAVVGANHLYRPAGARAVAEAGPAPKAAPLGQNVLGVIDTGADLTQPLLAAAVQKSKGFGGRGFAAGDHGAEVASLAAQAGLRLAIADVFDLDSHGDPVASADAIARAMDWMVREGVPVINISIAGPSNPVLADVIARAVAKGHVVVAAAGNNGPNAPPAYPAAYAGAVAATAIDGRKHVYWKANQGRYIAFSAPGVALPVEVGGKRMVVSGTSFASPLVAAAFAKRMSAPSPQRAAEVLKELQGAAEDLGEPGWDPVYGWGRIAG
jgi:minor extracellular protease Epr